MSHNPRRGGVLVGLLFAVMILALLAASTGLYIGQSVRITERSERGETTVETPFGRVRVHSSCKLDPAALGVPVYPGAVRDEDGHKLAGMHVDLGARHREFAVAAAAYTTSDSLDKVADFYRDKLPHWMITQTDRGPFHDFELSLKRGGYQKIIAIFRDDGQTRIALASLGEPESN